MATSQKTIIQNPNQLTDSQASVLVKLKRGDIVVSIPFENILKFTYIESQDSVLFNGEIVFSDKKGFVTQQINITAKEDVEIEFGGEEDNTLKINGYVYDVVEADKSNSDIQLRLLFSHPAITKITQATQAAYAGKSSDVVRDIIQNELGITSRFVSVATANYRPGGNDQWWINAGFKRLDYLDYLRRLSISTNNRAAYALFTTRDAVYFVPRDYWNTKLVEKPFREYYDTFNFEKYQRRYIMAASYNPINAWLEHVGASRRNCAGYDYDKGELLSVDMHADKIIPEKTFVGKYIFLPNENPDKPYINEYTGFKNKVDIEGYTTNKTEQMIERLSTCRIQVPGDVTLQPGQAIRINISSYDTVNQPLETFYSGKWIINSVAHIVTKSTGYICALELYRNAVRDVNDQSLLKKAQIINAS